MTWKPHIDGISAKLKKANAMLFKIRHFVDQKTLKAIYETKFESHLYFFFSLGTEFWFYKKTVYLTKKTLRLIFFLRREAHTNPIFNDCNTLKFHDKIIALENSILIHKSPLNINFPNHSITELDLPQIFIPTRQGGQILAVLMYFITELNYMEEILFVLVQFSLEIIFKTFIEIFYFIS